MLDKAYMFNSPNPQNSVSPQTPAIASYKTIIKGHELLTKILPFDHIRRQYWKENYSSSCTSGGKTRKEKGNSMG